MQSDAKKTAICFHAKDDPTEVRYQVFKLLPTLDVRIRIAVLSKDVLAETLRRLLNADVRGRFDENEMYDKLAQQLIHNQLHEADANAITFARRGKTARIEALAEAIKNAKNVFRKHSGQAADRPCHLDALFPSQCTGLQIIDYHLWAYQRMIEKGEDRFYRLIEGKVDEIYGDPTAGSTNRTPAIAELRTLHIRQTTKKRKTL